MQVSWMPNPLRSVVILDDADRWALREAMESDLDPDDSADPAWTNRLHDAFVEALSDVHVGDCTCVPCPCLKCHAEGYLGIDTTPGLTKYMAYKVADAFGREPERTIEDAITALANYEPKPSAQWDGRMDIWNASLPRWREEARQAHEWLLRYRDEHGFGVEPKEENGDES